MPKANTTPAIGDSPGERLRRVPLHRLYLSGEDTVCLWDTRHLALATRHPVAVPLWSILPLLAGIAVMIYGVGLVGDPSIPGADAEAQVVINSGAALFAATGIVSIVVNLVLKVMERRGENRSFITSVELPGISADDLSMLMYDDILSIPAREALACLADGQHVETVVQILTGVALDESPSEPGQVHPRTALSGWYRQMVSPA